jgi:hypothetical protein
MSEITTGLAIIRKKSMGFFMFFLPAISFAQLKLDSAYEMARRNYPLVKQKGGYQY